MRRGELSLTSTMTRPAIPRCRRAGNYDAAAYRDGPEPAGVTWVSSLCCGTVRPLAFRPGCRHTWPNSDLIDSIRARGNDAQFPARDDAALLAPLPGYDLVVSTDTLVEGVHFPASTSARSRLEGARGQPSILPKLWRDTGVGAARPP